MVFLSALSSYNSPLEGESQSVRDAVRGHAIVTLSPHVIAAAEALQYPLPLKGGAKTMRRAA